MPLANPYSRQSKGLVLLKTFQFGPPLRYSGHQAPNNCNAHQSVDFSTVEIFQHKLKQAEVAEAAEAAKATGFLAEADVVADRCGRRGRDGC